MMGSRVSVTAVCASGRSRAVPKAQAEQMLKAGATLGVCAWTKPAEYHPFEFCENGAKATAWELTSLRAGADVLQVEIEGAFDHAGLTQR